MVEELKAVFDPRGGAWMQGKYVPSILAAIGGVIERHMVAIGFIEGEGMGLKEDPQAASGEPWRKRAARPARILRSVRDAHGRRLHDLRLLRPFEMRLIRA